MTGKRRLPTGVGGDGDHAEDSLEYMVGGDGPVLRRRRGSSGRRIADLFVSVDDDPDEALDRLVEGAALAGRVESAAHRLGATPTEAVGLLEHFAEQTPAGARLGDNSLTEADENVLREAGSLSSAFPQVWERPSSQTALRARRLLEAAFSVRDAAALLGVSESRVRQRIAERSLVGVLDGSVWRVPQFQFENGGDLRGLADLLRALPEDIHPLSIAVFLERVNVDLVIDGEATTPREWLATGGAVQPVIVSALNAYRLP